MDLTNTVLDQLEKRLETFMISYGELQQQYQRLEKSYLQLEQKSDLLEQKNHLARTHLMALLTTLKANLPHFTYRDETSPSIPTILTEEDD